MNALVKGEYDKLTFSQKLKFQELVSWQNSTHKGDAIPIDDGTYFKILDWVKKLPESVAEPAKEET